MDTARRVEELYTAHGRLVRTVCRSLLRDRDEADDATQQTFLSAQRALANGSVPREPAAWLATIARNVCLARVRERMREPLPSEAEPTAFAADAHSVAASRYEMATLREALADLPRLQREAILLRELRGLSYDEVARALSVTTAAVESLIFRARRTLQGKLSEVLPSLSPFAFVGRLFGGGGGAAAVPAVAKVAAIGVGAAILAGGAALGPRPFGLGHAAAKTLHPSHPNRAVAAPPVISTPPAARIWSRPAPKPTGQAERDTPVTDTESSDSAGTSNSERDNETGAVSVVSPTHPSRAGASGSDAGSSDDSSPDN